MLDAPFSGMHPARTLRPGHRFASSIQPTFTRAARAQGAACTDTGKVREKNEDQFLIANVTSAIQVVSASVPQNHVYYGPSPAALFVVADGMGGHAAGERASALAVNTVEAVLLRALGRLGAVGTTTPRDLLHACFHSADEAVFDASQNHVGLKGMGTTMTVALACGSEVYVAHAGDSRAYHLRHGQLEQLTRDHTVAGELEHSGHISREQAETHPMRHMITNVIGGGSLGVTPEIVRVDALAGDRILLCSDGLTDMVSDARIGELLIEHADINVASTVLVGTALEAGGHDNVTALVISFA